MKSFLYTLLIFTVLDALLLVSPILAHNDTATSWLALEALCIVIIMGALPAAWKPPVATLLAVCMTLLVLLAAVDGLMQLSFGRNFNPLLDLTLTDSAYHQLTQNLGGTLAALALCAAAVGIIAFTVLLALGLSRLPSLPLQRFRSLHPLFLVVLTGVPIIAHLSEGRVTPGWQRINMHWHQVTETRQALADFQQRLAKDFEASAHPLPRLAGHDVILGFVESYGVSAVFDPPYRQLVQSRLTHMEQQLQAANLHIATSRLTSPVQGGQSWLAHATLLSGLWLPTQQHYEIFLKQQPPTLIEDLKATGHVSLAIMPAITAPWPEGKRLGYDRIYDAQSIPYQGPAFNWVTIPDQYTWYFLEQLRTRYEAPLFAELALISSHAPWTPIVPLLDWEGLAQGRIFERWAQQGPTPEQLWRDAQQVRSHYALSIDYALAAATGYAERYINKNALLILIGDHQPASLITGANASQDVPIHVISDSRELVASFIEAGFIPGSLPPPASASWRMDEFRHLVQEAFKHSEMKK